MRVWVVFRVGLAGFVVVAHVAIAQSAPAHKPKTATKTTIAVWSPDVQEALGVSATDFKTAGLNKLTQTQLQALESSAKSHPYIDPKKYLLSCAANSLAPGARVQVLVTVAGDDATGQRAVEIRKAVQSLSGVDLVDAATNADRALHVVIQEQTLGKRTIGYTASYVTASPCTDDVRKSDAELKGQLGTYTDPKGVDLARDLAGMLDKDLQEAKTGPS